MSKEKETDAATVLSQMSQLGNISFDLSTSSTCDNEQILEEDAIGATCTLQPSSLEADMLFPLHDDRFSLTSRNVQSDPYISFDDADHPYAVNASEIPVSVTTIGKHRSNNSLSTESTMQEICIPFIDGAEHPYAVTSSLSSQSNLNKKWRQKGDVLECRICNKTFSQRNSLMVHLNFHSGRKPHSCNKCTKAFTTKADLKRHMLVHTPKSLKEKFQCDICSSTFRDQASKTRHMKNHSKKNQFKCDLCSKTFPRADMYKNHKNTHQTSKQYKCQDCGSEFNYKSSYNRHVASHSTESYYICDICGKTFRRLDYVESHKKSVHSDGKKTSKTTKESKQNKVQSKRKTKPEKQKQVVKKKKCVKEKACKTTSILSSPPLSYESGEAEAILTSMAEQASKPKKSYECISPPNFLNDTDSPLVSPDSSVNIPLGSPQIDHNLITYLDETSNDELSELSECETILSDNELIIDLR